ncbi:MAG: phage replisome organizer N-terminal domain-containing protein [Lachnospiraceae bacterium]|nr:phage replisome organizer N-terminal domain-containing protein [Lachnospiraceae bacterium]
MADNRKYYYLKLKEGFFESEEIKILESMKDGYIYSNILLKLYLRSLRNEGRLMYRNVIPYTPEVLATLVGHQVGTVEKALEIFRNLELIEILDNGAIYMMDIQNFIGQSSTEADRQRAYYNRVKGEKALLQVTENGVEPTAAPQRTEPAEKSAGKSNKAINNYHTDFEEFWAIYPRKADKAQAYKKYKARLEDGFFHEQLLEAAKNYADQCKRDRTEDKYIKHGKTFLGESTPFLDYLPKNAPAACTESINDDENPFRKG